MVHPEGVCPASAQPNNPSDESPTTFDEVLQHELESVNVSRQARGVQVRADEDNLIGLAFSGGGVRSATFNLGILQALARARVLHKFDYLSTVSGGGYIGAWFSALTRRFMDRVPSASFQDVERQLLGSDTSALRWLRHYSNFLTPRTGPVSSDCAYRKHHHRRAATESTTSRSLPDVVGYPACCM